MIIFKPQVFYKQYLGSITWQKNCLFLFLSLLLLLYSWAIWDKIIGCY